MKFLKYTIPVWLYLALLCLAWADAVAIYFLLLVAMICVETMWGEFGEAELRRELKFYYGNRHLQRVKMANALLFVLSNGALLCQVANLHPDNWNYVALLLATAYCNGTFMLALAHDFSHASSTPKRWLGNLLLFILCLPFFRADHVFGHHEQVGTCRDESSARLNQNFYDYVVRTFIQRIRRGYSRKSDLPPAYKSAVLRDNFVFTTLLAGFGAALFFIQPVLLWFWLGQSALVYLMFELTNYVQHYGLRRNSGEAVGMGHSWNNYFKYSNYISSFLLVHSPHHAEHPLRETNLLAGPRLPYPFFLLFLLALIPRLWFRAMNPLVAAVQIRRAEPVRPVFKKSPAIGHLSTSQNQNVYAAQS